MYEGWTVPLEYDPLLAKLIGYAQTRDEAIARLQRALVEYFVGGIKTNISLFRRILRDPEFQAGNIDTGFLDRLLKQPQAVPSREAEEIQIAAIAAAMFAQSDPKGGAQTTDTNGHGQASSSWRRAARVDSLR
jgi:acetyl-CoA carboxylase, biotin carboxylase subunit